MDCYVQPTRLGSIERSPERTPAIDGFFDIFDPPKSVFECFRAKDQRDFMSDRARNFKSIAGVLFLAGKPVEAWMSPRENGQHSSEPDVERNTR